MDLRNWKLHRIAIALTIVTPVTVLISVFVLPPIDQEIHGVLFDQIIHDSKSTIEKCRVKKISVYVTKNGTNAIPDLRCWIINKELSKVEVACEILGTNAKPIVPDLQKYLREEDSECKKFALRVFSTQIRDYTALADAVVLLGDKDAAVRNHAVLFIGESDVFKIDGGNALLRALSDEDDEVRRSALIELEKLDKPTESVIRVVKNICLNDTKHNRILAAVILSRSRVDRDIAIPVLKQAQERHMFLDLVNDALKKCDVIHE